MGFFNFIKDIYVYCTGNNNVDEGNVNLYAPEDTNFNNENKTTDLNESFIRSEGGVPQINNIIRRSHEFNNPNTQFVQNTEQITNDDDFEIPHAREPVNNIENSSLNIEDLYLTTQEREKMENKNNESSFLHGTYNIDNNSFDGIIKDNLNQSSITSNDDDLEIPDEKKPINNIQNNLNTSKKYLSKTI